MDDNKSIVIMREIKTILCFLKKNMKNSFNNFNLTAPQGMLIEILCRYGEMKISDLSNKMGLSSSTVSGIVDRLEKQGLVKRTRSDEDRRVVYVDVTDKFKNGFQGNFKKIEQEFENMMNKASPGEIDSILNGLHILKNLVSKKK
ncbi:MULTISPECIES: MarR family winged helix-turn-helix transcriptional regulator [Clostridium]|uniref:Organic hydroperoxide resistance transcriptional regulator n=3 Tax=Clostridium TaxID=1485 RepID=D8GI89_CLOLD|nr:MULTISPECIES: MarR family transcriptional regulator [Clostridium]ADK14951.1 predicted transcriptional regulator [Clostridium ljungdahlii DSM 13528]OAA87945.1 Organic hydroperoxide resistance transcriptional regulator [Clostridium ljungdahlii DSM 13528]OAA94032.1 Organic hydroperoxide resistance transcriptional regulator [Clostridium coskatii]OBR96594.1 organic hydroperoxide resistance transcriptional regulator [Clostridium coskatii]RMD03278.1 MarR family transcriptional regulator [Clostridi